MVHRLRQGRQSGTILAVDDAYVGEHVQLGGGCVRWTGDLHRRCELAGLHGTSQVFRMLSSVVARGTMYSYLILPVRGLSDEVTRWQVASHDCTRRTTVRTTQPIRGIPVNLRTHCWFRSGRRLRARHGGRM